jgi:hypothetical protein
VDQSVYLQATSAMQGIVQIVVPFFFASGFPDILILRRKPRILEPAIAYSTVSVRVVFSTSVYQSLDRHLIPLYAFLLASSPRLRAVAIAAGLETLSMMSPVGSVNMVIAIGCIVAILAIQDFEGKSSVTRLRDDTLVSIGDAYTRWLHPPTAELTRGDIY